MSEKKLMVIATSVQHHPYVVRRDGTDWNESKPVTNAFEAIVIAKNLKRYTCEPVEVFWSNS